MNRDFAARRLDIRAFAEQGGEIAGEESLAAFTRLMVETQGRGGDRPVSWEARGEWRHPHHVHPEAWLHLEADVTLALTCQRCLGEIEIPVQVRQVFRFAPDEETAAAQDDDAEEDVLAMSRSFDLIKLVEDELLMAIPVVPRHGTCPEAVRTRSADADFVDEPPAAHPFALLGNLKGRKK